MSPVWIMLIEARAPGLKFGHVAREEVASLAVEKIEVALVDLT